MKTAVFAGVCHILLQNIDNFFLLTGLINHSQILFCGQLIKICFCQKNYRYSFWNLLFCNFCVENGSFINMYENILQNLPASLIF